MSYTPPERVRGLVLGLFGPAPTQGKSPAPTHALVVNLDYAAGVSIGLKGPKRLEAFDPASGKWTRQKRGPADIALAPGAGRLFRIAR